jgi:outer membrane protein
MRHQVFTRVIAFTTLVTLTRTSTAAERPLKLDDAIALALQKNDALVIERESVASAKAAVMGASGAYDPQLELEGGWQRTNEPVNSAFSGAPVGRAAPTLDVALARATIRKLLPTGGQLNIRAATSRSTNDGAFVLLSPAYDSRVGIELRQPLWRGLLVDAARTSVRVARAEQKRSLASLRREITQAVAAVEDAYWRLVAARREVEVRAESVRLADEQLAETRIRVEKGAAPKDEVAEPRAELERRRGTLYGAQENTARAENELKLLILADSDSDLWSTQFAPTDSATIDIVRVDVQVAMNQALASRPELAAATADIEGRHAETELARNGIWPQLDAVASYDRFGLAGQRNPDAAPPPGLPTQVAGNREGDWGQSFQSLTDESFDDVWVGVELGIPIGNRTARAAAATARSREKQANSELARARKVVRSEVLDAAAALETAVQRIAAARAGREAAETQLSSERDRYDAGLSTNFLVLTRQNQLSLARLIEISAQTDYRTARTEMARATGSLLEQRRIDVQ